jgi:hypothetical protein
VLKTAVAGKKQSRKIHAATNTPGAISNLTGGGDRWRDYAQLGIPRMPV